MRKRVVVIGAGYGGLAAAAKLAAEGREVTVLEKNEAPGGRGRSWRSGGYLFDMGPSWYLMPEVFEAFFAGMGRRREDYYALERLSTYYQVFFGDGTSVEIDSDLARTRDTFASLEPGGDRKLDEYLKAAKYKYDTAMGEFLYRDYGSVLDFFNRKLLTEGLKLDVLTSLDRFVRRSFSDIRARQLLEYAMVFLGASPSNAPALYSIMSHVDLGLGVWFPKGGMWSVSLGLERLAKEAGARIEYGTPATGIVVRGGKAVAVATPRGEVPADLVLANADYAHVELELLGGEGRSYGRRYWDKAVLAPSMLIAYLGVPRKLPGLRHHNLYFSSDWDAHFRTIFDRPAWPEDPCFYLSAVSKTDPSVAPAGEENLFLLVPVAPGLADDDAAREALFDKAMGRLEGLLGEELRPGLSVRRLYSQRDFKADYNALGGTALGLAHTLGQTAVFRPSRRSRKVGGLYFAGQYTHPGVGVPMTLIAAELAAAAIRKDEA